MCDGLSPASSNDLLHRWLDGDDQEAAAELWRRHVARLIGLARRNLSADMARQVDPEDVVQSVYLKFFAAARTSTPDLKDSDDLWRLLVAIMRNKMRDHHKRQQAQKRKADVADDPASDLAHLQDPQLPPGEQAAVADELNRMFGALKPCYRRMVGLRLEGWKVEEIAADTASNERTVRRVLKRVQSYLRKRCEHLAD
jgi:RNA polymerase sigma factor (sigma-70 family)